MKHYRSVWLAVCLWAAGSAGMTQASEPVSFEVKDMPLARVVAMLRGLDPQLQVSLSSELGQQRVTISVRSAPSADDALQTVLAQLHLSWVRDNHAYVVSRPLVLAMRLALLGPDPGNPAPYPRLAGKGASYDPPSGLYVMGEPSPDTVSYLFSRKPSYVGLRVSISSSTLPTASGGENGAKTATLPDDLTGHRTGYLAQVAPGLYRRIDLDEQPGYSATVTVRAPNADGQDVTRQVTVELVRDEIIGGQFDMALGAYMGRPSVRRLAVTTEASIAPGRPALFIWTAPAPNGMASRTPHLPLVLLVELTDHHPSE